MGNKHRITPDELMFHFKAYVVHTKGKPFEVEDWVGAMATPVKRKKEKPLLMSDFRAYMAWSDLSRNLKDYFNNRDNSYDDYKEVCDMITDSIYADQQSGSMVGLFNAGFTAKLQGMADKIETTNTSVSILNIDPLE